MRPLLTRVTSRVRAPRAAGFLGRGGGRGARQTKAGGRGGRRGLATPSGPRRPSTAPRPARLSIPFVWRPRARVRGAGGGEPRRPESGRPAARRAHPRHPYPRRSWGETPAPLQGPASLPGPRSSLPFSLSLVLVPSFPCALPGRGLGSGRLGAGVEMSPSKAHLPPPPKEELAPPVSSPRRWRRAGVNLLLPPSSLLPRPSGRSSLRFVR